MGDGSIAEGDLYESSRQPEVLGDTDGNSSGLVEAGCAAMVLAIASAGTPCVRDTDGNSIGLEEASISVLLANGSGGTLIVGDTDGNSSGLEAAGCASLPGAWRVPQQMGTSTTSCASEKGRGLFARTKLFPQPETLCAANTFKAIARSPQVLGIALLVQT